LFLLDTKRMARDAREIILSRLRYPLVIWLAKSWSFLFRFTEGLSTGGVTRGEIRGQRNLSIHITSSFWSFPFDQKTIRSRMYGSTTSGSLRIGHGVARRRERLCPWRAAMGIENAIMGIY
jgi:hypothetical protein